MDFGDSFTSPSVNNMSPVVASKPVNRSESPGGSSFTPIPPPRNTLRRAASPLSSAIPRPHTESPHLGETLSMLSPKGDNTDHVSPKPAVPPKPTQKPVVPRKTIARPVTRRAQSAFVTSHVNAIQQAVEKGIEQTRPKVQPRTSIARTEAFSIPQRPTPVQRRITLQKTNATDAHDITTARKAFIENTAPQKVQLDRPASSLGGGLDLFDPLATGQLAVDAGSLSGSGSSSSLLAYDSSSIGSRTHSLQSIDSGVSTSTLTRDSGPDEDLLKDWSLGYFESTKPKPVIPRQSYSPRPQSGYSSPYTTAPYRYQAPGAQPFSNGNMSRPPILAPHKPSAVALALQNNVPNNVQSTAPTSSDPFSDILAKVTNNNTTKTEAWPPQPQTTPKNTETKEFPKTDNKNRRSQWERFE